jgi:hypothetical protein
VYSKHVVAEKESLALSWCCLLTRKIDYRLGGVEDTLQYYDASLLALLCAAILYAIVQLAMSRRMGKGTFKFVIFPTTIRFTVLLLLRL